MRTRKKLYYIQIIILLVFLFLFGFVYKEYNTAKEEAVSSTKALLLSDEFAREKNRVEKFFSQIYQTIRTISLIPSVRKIEGGNRKSVKEDVVLQGRFSTEGHETVQQLYNNLVTNSNVSEVYAVLDGLKPGEIPFFMYDSYILQGVEKLHRENIIIDETDYPVELEEEEYAYYPEQISYFKRLYPEFNYKNLDDIPAVSSFAMRTCDNTQYISKSLGDPVNALGTLYSVPLYNDQNRLIGIISAIFRLNVLEAHLLDVPFIIVTEKDRKRAGEIGFRMPEQKGNFALVNELFGVYVADRRNIGFIDTVKSFKPSFTGNDDFHVKELNIKDQGRWKLFYRYNPAVLEHTVLMVRHKFTSRFVLLISITLLISVWQFLVYRRKEQLKSEIAGRKKAEGSLRLFKKLINQSNDALFLIQPETGAFLDINDKACENLGYTRTELLNMKVIDIEAVLPDDFSWEQHIREIREAGFVIVDGKHRRKDGTVFPVEVNVKYITEENKSYMVAIARDITERKKSEEERERMIVELKNAISEVKVLSGMLPICSSCKKIRNDEGYWEQVEVYIDDHSEAEFSHGLCPECVKILYPNLIKREK